MSKLSDFLVESILNEAPEKVVALFGGGFKPPTKGHLEVVNNGLKNNPEVSEIKILVGGGERNGFTQDQSVKIWNLYNDIGFIDKPATIIPVSSPFTYYKNYLKDNPDDKVYVFIGSRPGEEKDQFDVKQRSEFVKKYSDNVVPVEVATGGGVSGTMARELFKTDLDGFRNMFPENLIDTDWKKILNILNNKEEKSNKVVSNKTEPLKPVNEDIIDKTDFVLPRGKKMILQAEDEDYNRGLIVELTNEGGYKMNYWYGDNAKVYPVEVEIDGESIKPDANEVYMKLDPASQKKHKGKAAPFGSAYEPLNENATYSSKIDYKQQIKDLTKHMLDKGMNIQPLPRVIFKHGDQENASQFLGKTAYYDPNNMAVVLYTEGRHPKDIVRSFAHEMIHHIQNLEGRLEDINTTNTNEDDDLNDIEREAYTRGNMVFRNWTDNKDGDEVTSLNEGPQFGVLYHYTEFLLNILDDNMLRGPISLTRSRDSFVKDWLGSIPILVLDKDKLRTKYKIKPYQDYDDDDAERFEDEMEEVIDTNVTNLSKYIIKVILPKPNEEYEDALKEKGIPYEIDKPLNEVKKGVNNSIVAILSRKGNQISLYDVDNKEPLGLINTYGNEVTGVAAKKGYGPLMYELGMANVYPNGLQSDRNGNTEPAAEAVLNKFIEGASPNIKVVKLTPEDKDYRTKYPNGNEVWDVDGFYNHKFYNADTSTLKQLLQRGNELYPNEQKQIISDTEEMYDSIVNEEISNLNEKNKDPFGLMQFARELIDDNSVEENVAEHLAPQEKVRIFTQNCGCDKT